MNFSSTQGSPMTTDILSTGLSSTDALFTAPLSSVLPSSAPLSTVVPSTAPLSTVLPSTALTINSASPSETTIFILPKKYVDHLNEDTAIKLAVPIIYVAIMMLIGVFGNVLVIYIYGCRWHRATTKIFVTTLAVLDLVNCIITMPTEIVILRNFYYLDTPVYCQLSRFSTFWMNNNSAIVLLIISIDRFIKICKPNKTSFSYKGAKMACGVAVLIGLAVSWPALVIYGKQTVFYPTKRGFMKFVLCHVDDSVKDKWYSEGYYIYLWVGFIATAVVMVVLYTLIGVQIWMRKLRKDKRTESVRTTSFQFSIAEGRKIYKGSAEKRSESGPKIASDDSSVQEMADDVFKSSDSSSDAVPQPRNKRLPTLASIKFTKHGIQAGRATLMLAIITVVYVISFLPFLVITMMRTVLGDTWYPNLSDGQKVAVNLFLRSYLVSNTVNPIIYGFCNVQFRRECMRLCRRMACRKTNLRSQGSYSSTFAASGTRPSS
ncbi:gastrin/cholecystokinin type B receptor-like isoform X1 [Haliotis rufescens]|uniref:gastrin/cholecystokinin type B receptor-like isoform X1 n=2 Tax=Haliotis rufescens TaxID=6454 RepID=UPI001EAFEAB4|nr:gastrin/cholecystokinin type B receptor-like isoform X1 [Haliotis rufescens]